MKRIKTFEKFNMGEGGLGEYAKKLFTKTSVFTKSVWEATKRESAETKDAVKILGKMVKGENVTDNEKKFVKAQSVDILKILPLVAIQGIPVPLPITPLLILLGKRYGIDILPNSQKKLMEDKDKDDKK